MRTISFQKKNKKSSGLTGRIGNPSGEIGIYEFFERYALDIYKEYQRPRLGLDSVASAECFQEAAANMFSNPENTEKVKVIEEVPKTRAKGSPTETLVKIKTVSRVSKVPRTWALELEKEYLKAVNNKELHGRQKRQADSQARISDTLTLDIPSEGLPTSDGSRGISLLDYSAYGKPDVLDGIGNNVWDFIEETVSDNSQFDNDPRVNKEIAKGLILLFSDILQDSFLTDMNDTDFTIRSRGVFRKEALNRAVGSLLKTDIRHSPIKALHQECPCSVCYSHIEGVGYSADIVQRHLGPDIDILSYRDVLANQLNMDIASIRGWNTTGRRNPDNSRAGISKILRTSSFQGASDAALILWDRLCTIGRS